MQRAERELESSVNGRRRSRRKKGEGEEQEEEDGLTVKLKKQNAITRFLHVIRPIIQIIPHIVKTLRHFLCRTLHNPALT